MYLFMRQRFLSFQRTNSLITIFAYSLSLDFDLKSSSSSDHVNTD